MSDKQPNIVLIMSDDLGYEVIGANGGTSYATPRLDQMAQERMRFEEAGLGDPMLVVGNFLAHLRWTATSVGRKRRTQRARIMLFFKALHSSAGAAASRS